MWVDSLQKRLHIFLILDHSHRSDKLPELVLINNAVIILIHHLKELGEAAQELLVFLKLEV